jgi:hypothetical protein
MTFYVYYDKNNLNPVSVSGQKMSFGFDDSDKEVMEIDDDLGALFILGQANLLHYFVSFDDEGKPRLIKKTRQALTTFSRIASLRLVELTKEIHNAPIQIEVDCKKDQIKIFYDGALLQYNPFKLYFTKEDDPSYLLCAVHLDVNTLDAILVKNRLKKWPNPLVFNLPTDDLSIYSLKTPIQISIKKKNVKARNNRVRSVLPVV